MKNVNEIGGPILMGASRRWAGMKAAYPQQHDNVKHLGCLDFSGKILDVAAFFLFSS